MKFYTKYLKKYKSFYKFTTLITLQATILRFITFIGLGLAYPFHKVFIN